MSNYEFKSAGQILRERFFELKKNRKFSPEIKEMLEKHKEEFLKNKIQSFSDYVDLSLIDDSSIKHIFEIIENYTEKISVL